MSFSVETLSIHIIELTVDVKSKVSLLDAFPLVTVELGCVKSETDLLLSELSVLAKCVHADHILNFLGREGLKFDDREVGRPVFVRHIVSLAFIFAISLFVFVIASQLFLLLLLVANVQSVVDTIVVG